MGCWNGTCGISRLPLHSGDPVVALLIAYMPDGKEASGYCYATGEGHPISFPFEGNYNDYGGIENIKVDPLDVALIRKTYDFGDLTYFETWVNEKVERDEVPYKAGYNPNNVPYGVGLWMVHKEIWDYFIDPKMPDQMTKAITKIKAKKAKMLQEFDGDEKLAAFLCSSKRAFEEVQAEYPYGDKRGKGARSLYWLLEDSSGRHPTASRLFDDLDLDNPEMVKQFAEGATALSCIRYGIENLRIGFGSQTGKGSQNSALKSHLKFHNAISKFVKEKIRRITGENGGDYYDRDDGES